MIEARRRAYLEAMGFDVWLARPAPAGPPRLVVGPGAGSTLLVCPAVEATGGKIASDIARAVGADPAWAWPDPEGVAERPTLQDAVGDRLFTRLVVFGEALARELFGAPAPEVLGSSAVCVAPTLEDLAARPDARRAFWRQIRVRG